jgi:hypothetical protein
MLDEDALRLREMSLVLKWLFGPPGLHVRDYQELAGMKTPYRTKREEQGNGTISLLPASVQPRRRG